MTTPSRSSSSVDSPSPSSNGAPSPSASCASSGGLLHPGHSFFFFAQLSHKLRYENCTVLSRQLAQFPDRPPRSARYFSYLNRHTTFWTHLRHTPMHALFFRVVSLVTSLTARLMLRCALNASRFWNFCPFFTGSDDMV
eukprot:CAMPEP_0181367356 /NCGR_PEP_ID=MMETSP1106-20121128/11337_1 /TAXON_ID=81844 /ORGANISM="Mantoniella antarctica, Strain SL-175" /LENGTH=138 /DNA_ID=CAMNT_0023483053 /DNA_START=366 /DNA_END=782 /DNA_ORIENTATION=+